MKSVNFKTENIISFIFKYLFILKYLHLFLFTVIIYFRERGGRADREGEREDFKQGPHYQHVDLCGAPANEP